VSSSAAVTTFVDYFGELGPRWGLPADACRAHAFLYLAGGPVAEADIAEGAGLAPDAATTALAFLADYKMITPAGEGAWTTGGDPWDIMMGGLRERRRREIGPALAKLRDCHRRAREDSQGRAVALRIGRMLSLAEDLAAIDAQAARLSPSMLKGLVGLSSRAARLASQAFGEPKEETP
jgi:DNA-binding transcriptional regulator GbsR (MarR family)